MRVNRKEERLSRLVQREDLKGLFYAIPRIERGRFFRFMKRQGWIVGLTVKGMLNYNDLFGNGNDHPAAYRSFFEQLMEGKSIGEIGAHMRCSSQFEARYVNRKMNT